MEQYPLQFLRLCDAARMSPSPLVGLPPIVELLRHRSATCIGDNFTLMLMNVISAFTCTVGQQQKSYLQVHLSADGREREETLKRVQIDCDHLFTSGIGNSNKMNFRVFSYILYGFSGEGKERFFINRNQNDFLSQSSIQDVNLIARLREEYIDFTNAMEVLVISFASQLELCTRMTAIVHLTEIEFYEDGFSSNLPALKNVARLIQF
ncbi:hypothetical protein LSM04_007268 [Trypanosoma melophagium]|uniref:uncharacterized protein n=1 Tax=Trypanosoma melophagium TaxID=715481 RepID=UPI00351A3DF5|nr:hypothetical protein LSM04_007268 [Trypanosoma melophagium]